MQQKSRASGSGGDLRLAFLASGRFAGEMLLRAAAIARSILDAAGREPIGVQATLAADLSGVEHDIAEGLRIEPLETVAAPGTPRMVQRPDGGLGRERPFWRRAVNPSVEASDLLVVVGDDTRAPIANGLSRPSILVPSAWWDGADTEIYGDLASPSWVDAYRAILPNRRAAARIAVPDAEAARLLTERWGFPPGKVAILPVPILPAGDAPVWYAGCRSPCIDWFFDPDSEPAEVQEGLAVYYGPLCGQLTVRACPAGLLAAEPRLAGSVWTTPVDGRPQDGRRLAAGPYDWLRPMIRTSARADALAAPGPVVVASARVVDRFDSVSAWANATGARLVLRDSRASRSAVARQAWRVPPLLAADPQSWARAVWDAERALLRTNPLPAGGAPWLGGRSVPQVEAGQQWLTAIGALIGKAPDGCCAGAPEFTDRDKLSHERDVAQR